MEDALNQLIKNITDGGVPALLSLFIGICAGLLYLSYHLYQCVKKKDSQIQDLNNLLINTIQKSHQDIAELIVKQQLSNDEVLEQLNQLDKSQFELSTFIRVKLNADDRTLHF